MNLYSLKDKTLSQIQHQDFELEKDLQAIVENNLDTLFGLTFVSSELTAENDVWI